MKPAMKLACDVCEQVIQQDRTYNLEHDILPRDIVIADRLLARRTELMHAYAELHEKLSQYPHALKGFFEALFSVAVLWNADRNEEARAGRNRLTAVNQQIAREAALLANLLEEREHLQNYSGFRADTHYHPLDLIDAAGSANTLYQAWAKEALMALPSQFDLKYWPKISECLWALSHNAESAQIAASDPITEAATHGQRTSLADVIKALFAAIKEQVRPRGHLPRFTLTDASLASLANCALDLGPDNLIDAAYMKRLRQRERTKATGSN